LKAKKLRGSRSRGDHRPTDEKKNAKKKVRILIVKREKRGHAILGFKGVSFVLKVDRYRPPKKEEARPQPCLGKKKGDHRNPLVQKRL